MTENRTLCLGVLFLASLCACQVNRQGPADDAKPYVYRMGRRTEDCIRSLQAVYEQKGMRAFLDAKALFTSSLRPFAEQINGSSGSCVLVSGVISSHQFVA